MLKDLVQAGDIILLEPRNPIGRIIAKITFGKVNHAALVYDSEQMFEARAEHNKTEFTPIEKYDKRRVYVVRPNYIVKNKTKMKELCNKYNGKPYSFWDIATNAFFFFLTRPLRTKVVSFFGNKEHMVCSEVVARILYEATGYEAWKDFEGITPEDIRDVALENPADHTIQFYDLSTMEG